MNIFMLCWRIFNGGSIPREKEAILMLDECSIAQRDEINRLSLRLRKAYYDMPAVDLGEYDKPYGGEMTESIGAWPEFILRGTFCKRSSKGLCSPCFYSRSPFSKSSRSDYLGMAKSQVKYITSNFKTLVVDGQYGKPHSGTPVSLVLTPTGSYFDNVEFPIDIRLEMEQDLVNIAQENNIDILLHIESHCEDFLEFDEKSESHKKELELLRKLHTKIIFGFESADEYARNVIYNKRLALSDFEDAVKKASNAGLTPGAFVFAGLFAYNDLQTHDDVISSVEYLTSNSVFPVLMFQNAQPYTITDLLLETGKITLLEPLTVAWIIADVIDLLEKNNSYWLIADPIGGPPKPDSHIFKNPIITPKKITDEIYDALVMLRKTRNTKNFTEYFNTIQEGISYPIYKKHLLGLPTGLKSAQTNTNALLQVCQHSIEQYLKLSGGKA